MSSTPPPGPDNHYLATQVEPMLSSLVYWSGRKLADAATPALRAENIYHAPFALLAHDGGEEPHITYANLAGQRLFGMSWEEIIGLPSRETAEEERRESRAEVLRQVAEQGYVDGYSGVRIGKGGRRFRIEQVTLWNLRGEEGAYLGQAALIEGWSEL